MFISKKFTEEEFIAAVASSSNTHQLLKTLGLVTTTPNYATATKRIQELNLDTSHWGAIKVRAPAVKNGLHSILKANGKSVKTSELKKRLYKEGLLKPECVICGITNWQNQSIVLHLDHINGDSLDHRLENLRILCPNCHSQTSTYAGRNRAKVVSTPTPKASVICKCGQRKSSGAPHCMSCRSAVLHAKRAWPSDVELAALVWQKPTTRIAASLGITSNAVKKYCRKRKISQPPRGYWSKVAAGKSP